jgi:hypothetical protein
VVLWAGRISWESCDALLAGAAVESPSVRVLRDSEILHGITMRARWQHHIREAGGTRLKWAAVGDFSDTHDVVELGIPFEVEIGITDWRRRISARLAFWNLVVDVKVLCATGLLFAGAAMLREHNGPVGIAIVMAVS